MVNQLQPNHLDKLTTDDQIRSDPQHADTANHRRPSAGAMLHLRSRLLPLLRAATHPTAASSSPLHLCCLLSSSANASASASQTPFSIEEYLVATCGLSHAQALKASKKIPHLKSASNPDAVLALLSGVGLSRPDIAAVVAADPLFLRARAYNIARRLASLRDRVGLSDPQIARFLLVGGAMSLRSCNVAPRMEFWIPFFGSFDKLLQAVRRNIFILKSDIEKVAKPNIALLGQCGLNVCDMAKLSARSRLLVCNPERVKAFVLRADKLGVPRSSYAFKYAVDIASCITEDKVAARLEFLRSTLGCSMEKLRVAVCKRPAILGLSEEILRRKIEFMVTEVGLEPEYIVERPILFTYSLEKRMVPRHYVVKILQEKGLMKEGIGFRQLLNYLEDDFIAIYIDHHKDTVPGLADAYAAARAGDMPTKVSL